MLAALLLGALVLIDLSLSRSGMFNNRWSHEVAMREHDASMGHHFRQAFTIDDVERTFEQGGGSCEAGVRRFVLNGSDYNKSQGVTYCTVLLGGRLPFFFVSHKWDCAFAPGRREHLRLIGCQRQSGAT